MISFIHNAKAGNNIGTSSNIIEAENIEYENEGVDTRCARSARLPAFIASLKEELYTYIQGLAGNVYTKVRSQKSTMVLLLTQLSICYAHMTAVACSIN